VREPQETQPHGADQAAERCDVYEFDVFDRAKNTGFRCGGGRGGGGGEAAEGGECPGEDYKAGEEDPWVEISCGVGWKRG
jgi:hypothetical protein